MTRNIGIQRGLLIGGLALGHFVTTVYVCLLSFSGVMAHFDTGADETFQEHLTVQAAQILAFPGRNVAEYINSNYLRPWSGVVWLFNSIFWAVCVYMLMAFALACFRRKHDKRYATE